jgi:hypothetical protein
MAASLYFYEGFKLNLAKGDLQLDTDVFRVSLHKNITGVSDLTFSTYSQLGSAVTGGGYPASGKQASFLSLIVQAGATLRWNLSDVWFSANGSTIDSIRAFVLWQSNATQANAKLIAWGGLSSSSFSITDTNRLTIQWNASGVMELT